MNHHRLSRKKGLTMALKDWTQLCDAAGFEVKKLTAIDAYQIAGRIIHDPAVKKRKLEIARATGQSVLRMGTTIKILRNMSAADLTALRERVK